MARSIAGGAISANIDAIETISWGGGGGGGGLLISDRGYNYIEVNGTNSKKVVFRVIFFQI